ncbi:MAG: Rrf2 family transcriptional regulator [Planctomycetota bacterium]
MFSQTVEYALRAMVQLAHEAPEACTTKRIAEQTQVPGAYLAKVLQSMRKAGLVNSRRGVGGGVSLALPPKKISLLDVVNAVEPFERMRQRPLNLGTHNKGLRPLHQKIDQVMAYVQKSYGSTKLSDLINQPGQSTSPGNGPKPRRKRKKKK